MANKNTNKKVMKNCKVINCNKVRIRRAPSLTSDVLGILDNGDEIQLLKAEIENGWSKVKSGNIFGYIMSEYIQEIS